MEITLVILVSYLIGSIPTAVIISKVFFGFDIRQKGSGNMGSTNAFRILGWKAGLAVQLLDIFKGIAAVLLAVVIYNGPLPFPNATPFEDVTIVKVIAGSVAVIGHIWTAFAGFRGGKGINTALGMLIGITPVEVAVAAGIFMMVVFSSGYISLASMVAAVAIPGTMLVRYNLFHVPIEGYNTLIIFSIGLALLLIYTHRSNIQRLLEGREYRFNKLWLFRR
jgi:acyl phosphate:glycerol-3-phosphate acyltransferase